jgi:peptidoglycan hydrolase-like protein with peptidoglycan-binding domain
VKKYGFIGLLCMALLFCAVCFPALGEGDMLAEDDPGYEGEAVPMDDDDTLIEEDLETPTLQYGDSGEGVKALQARLAELHYYTGKISGNYLEGTRAAIKAFQADFGLNADGIADEDTQALLYSTEYRPLQYGSSGEDVKQLQTRLTELGYYTGKISGNYLDGSQAAISAFQQRNGLTATGKADVDTQTLLFSGQAIGKNDRGGAATPTPIPINSFFVDEDAPDQAVATPEESVPFDGNVKRGAKGTKVKKIQTRLTALERHILPKVSLFCIAVALSVLIWKDECGGQAMRK